jgi:transposase
MRGRMFSISYVSAEQRVPEDHPLRAIRAMVEVALRNTGSQFETMYAKVGRPSIPPEKLLRAFLLQVLYSVRSERVLCAWRSCPEFFSEVLAQARSRGLLSTEHFTVDGTLIEAWAGHKSFKRKDGGE